MLYYFFGFLKKCCFFSFFQSFCCCCFQIIILSPGIVVRMSTFSETRVMKALISFGFCKMASFVHQCNKKLRDFFTQKGTTLQKKIIEQMLRINQGIRVNFLRIFMDYFMFFNLAIFWKIKKWSEKFLKNSDMFFGIIKHFLLKKLNNYWIFYAKSTPDSERAFSKTP